jgi:hypothetical protein
MERDIAGSGVMFWGCIHDKSILYIRLGKARQPTQELIIKHWTSMVCMTISGHFQHSSHTREASKWRERGFYSQRSRIKLWSQCVRRSWG